MKKRYNSKKARNLVHSVNSDQERKTSDEPDLQEGAISVEEAALKVTSENRADNPNSTRGAQPTGFTSVSSSETPKPPGVRQRGRKLPIWKRRARMAKNAMRMFDSGQLLEMRYWIDKRLVKVHVRS